MARRRSSGIRRALRVLAALVAGGVASILAVLAVVLATPLGTRLALRGALEAYDGAVTARVTFDELSGTIARGIELRGVRIVDRDGRPLLEVDRLAIALDLWALAGKRVEVPRLEIDGAVLHRWHEGEAWADLAPERDAGAVEVDDGTFGPDLPLSIVGLARIETFTWIDHGSADAVLVEDAGLIARLSARGRVAEILIEDLHGELAAAGVGVTDGVVRASWSEPVADLSLLVLPSSLGRVDEARARIDFAAARAYFEAVAGLVVPGLPAHTERVDARLSVGGWLDQAWAAARAEPRCPDCTVGEGVSLHAEATRVDDRLTLTSVVRAATTEVWLDGRLERGAFTSGRVGLSCEDLAALRRSLRGFATLPALAGRLRARAHAAVRGDTLELDGRVAARLDTSRGPYGLRADAAGTPSRLAISGWVRDRRRSVVSTALVVEPGDPTRLHLSRLVIDDPRLQARLLEPAEVVVGRGRVAVDRLALAAAGGRVVAGGAIDEDERGMLWLRARDVDLGAIAAALGRDDLAGRVDARARVEGTMGRPELHARLDGRSLRFRDQAIGGGWVELGQRDGIAHGRLSWDGGSLGRIELELAVGTVVDLSARRFAVRPDAPLSLTMRLRGLELATVERFADFRGATGIVRVDAFVEGTPRAPTLRATVEAQDLVVDARALGDAALTAEYAEGMARARLIASGPMGDLEAEAVGPLEVDLAARRVKPRLQQAHSLALVAEGIELDRLPGLERLEPRGRVEARLMVAMDRGRPTGEANLVVHDLTVRGQPLGELVGEASFDHQELSLSLEGRGPAGSVAATARIPVALSILERPAWKRERPHELGISAHDVELSALTRLAGGPPMAGSGNLDLLVEGSGSGLEGRIFVEARELVVDRHPLGRARLGARYRAGRLELALDQRGKRPQWIHVEAEVPVAVDLTAKPRWHRRDPHRVSLRIAGLSERDLEALGVVPADWRLGLDARVDGRGSVDDFLIEAEARGSIGRRARTATEMWTRARIEPEGQHAVLWVGGAGPFALRGDLDVDLAIAEWLEGRADWRDAAVRASASAAGFPLAALEPLVPDTVDGLGGTLDLRVAAEGRLERPRVRGEVVVRDGAISVAPLRQRMTDVDLRARFDRSRIELGELSARSGGGRLHARGAATVAPGASRGEIEVDARRWPIVKPGIPILLFDGKVTTTLATRSNLSRIDVRIADARLHVHESNVGAPAEIPDEDGVVYVDARGVEARAERRSSRREPWLPRDVQLIVRLDDPVQVDGSGVDMAWVGGVEVDRRGEGDARVRGRFATERGRVTMLGNDFTIERAQIELPATGDLDPFVSLTAVTEVADTRVTLRIRGRASRPELRFSSVPAMAESDVFALLLTGRVDAGPGTSEEYQSKAASILTAFSNPALQRELHDRVGIDRMAVGFGQTVDQPVFTVGKRLTRDLYVETKYHHNAPPQKNRTEARVEYMFAPPAWTIETFFGDAASGGATLWWHRHFGGSPRGSPDRAAGPPP